MCSGSNKEKISIITPRALTIHFTCYQKSTSFWNTLILCNQWHSQVTSICALWLTTLSTEVCEEMSRVVDAICPRVLALVEGHSMGAFQTVLKSGCKHNETSRSIQIVFKENVLRKLIKIKRTLASMIKRTYKVNSATHKILRINM